MQILNIIVLGPLCIAVLLKIITYIFEPLKEVLDPVSNRLFKVSGYTVAASFAIITGLLLSGVLFVIIASFVPIILTSIVGHILGWSISPMENVKELKELCKRVIN